MTRPTTLGELRASGWVSRPVKDEVRANAIARIAAGKPLVDGVLGYEDTVLPQLENALLAGHDLILLGERGQAKTRIIRSLTELLDEWMPIVAGSEINDDPYNPISAHARALVEERGRFLLIESEELTQETSQRRQIHLGAINLHEALPAIRGATVPEILQKALDQVAEAGRRSGRPTLLHVNHPNYKWGVTAEDLAAVVGERFFEVWNGVDGDNDPGDALHPSTDQIWDIANTLRLAGLGAPPLQAVASDDSHDYQGNERHSPPFRAWIQVRARHLTPESLIRAIERGDFYASTGVVLEDVAFDADARRLSLRIHARPGERLTTRFLGTRRGVSLAGRPRLDAAGKVLETTLDYRSGTGPQIGEVLAEVTGPRPSYRMRGDELYVRAVVTSSRAPEVPTTEAEFQQAWTQPVGWVLGEPRN